MAEDRLTCEGAVTAFVPGAVYLLVYERGTVSAEEIDRAVAKLYGRGVAIIPLCSTVPERVRILPYTSGVRVRTGTPGEDSTR